MRQVEERLGEDIHEIKEGQQGDLYQNDKGDVYIRGKSGKGEGEPVGVNLRKPEGEQPKEEGDAGEEKGAEGGGQEDQGEQPPSEGADGQPTNEGPSSDADPDEGAKNSSIVDPGFFGTGALPDVSSGEIGVSINIPGSEASPVGNWGGQSNWNW